MPVAPEKAFFPPVFNNCFPKKFIAVGNNCMGIVSS
jgi:hypothetical protein